MKRSTLIPLLILVVLVIAYFAVYKSEEKSVSEKSVSNFLGLDSGAVNKINIRRLGTSVDLEKSGDNWNVLDRGKAFLAEKGTIEQLANLGHTLKVGDIISSNPDKQMVFQVDTLTGNTITFYRDGSELARVIIGKTGPDFQSTYIRKPESNDVYMAAGNFQRFLNRPASGYRDKTLLTIDTNMIASIIVKGKDADYQVVRPDSVWRVQPAKGDPFDPDPMKMSGLLRQLTNIRWMNAVEPGDTTRPNFASPTAEMDIAYKDGTGHALRFVAQGGEGKNFYVQSPTGDETFLIAEYVVNGLVKKPEDLKKTP